MNIDETNKKILAQSVKQISMIYPAENVARFLGRYYNDRNKNIDCSALDIGFGSGRNMKILLDYGFNVYGIDYVRKYIDAAKEKFQGADRLKELIIGDFSSYDFNMKFNVILACGVIFLRTVNDMKRDLSVIYNLLEKDGMCFIDFNTKDHFLYKNGEEIEKNLTYRINYSEYPDLIFNFLSEEELRSIVSEIGFKISSIERTDYWKNDLKERFSWWTAALSKS